MLSTLKSMFLAFYPLNTNVTIGKNPERLGIFGAADHSKGVLRR
jgi:hypothetical protein